LQIGCRQREAREGWKTDRHSQQALSILLHESLVTAELNELVLALGAGALVAELTDLANAEASDRVSRHLGRLVARAIEAAPERDRSATAIRIAEELIQRLEAVAGGTLELADDLPLDPGRVLHTVLRRLPDGTAQTIAADSALGYDRTD